MSNNPFRPGDRVRISDALQLGTVEDTTAPMDSECVLVRFDEDEFTWQWHYTRLELVRRAVRRPTEREFDAIDAIRAAYMACNACDLDGYRSALIYEVSVGNTYGGEPTAMGYLAAAGRAAWLAIGIDDCDMWDVMSDSGEDARYVFGLYAAGELDGQFRL